MTIYQRTSKVRSVICRTTVDEASIFVFSFQKALSLEKEKEKKITTFILSNIKKPLNKLLPPEIPLNGPRVVTAYVKMVSDFRLLLNCFAFIYIISSVLS